ncbi:MAG: hypothetical protein DVB22_001975 [Verrucomicrobia bacterium]|nr:MAG: hypothetical protein DVB22_001975 [Verrucomicrobiota bacterium]
MVKEGVWGERECGASRARACSEGWQAHSVRRESCNSDSSPEPAALWFGGVLFGERRAGAQRSQGLVRRGGQAHFVRRGSCDAHSSTEPAALLWGEREYGERRAGAQRSQGLVRRAGRRTPCAGRAVMLTAVQSLRLACTEGRVRRGASAEPRGAGLVGRAGRRTPCAERAVILTAVQSLRLACTEGRVRRGASAEPRGAGLVGRGWQAHSVRRESCDAPSSPKPAASLYGRGEYGERRAGAQRSQVRVGRAGLTRWAWGVSLFPQA